MQQLAQKFPLQLLEIPLLHASLPIVFARLDQLTVGDKSPVSGNKVCKLLPNLERARALGYAKIVSFGGVWSNHLHALAIAGKYYPINTGAIVRGERALPLNAMLCDAQRNGMQLHFVSRKNFRDLQSKQARDRLQALFGKCWVVPAGGSNIYGVLGVREMAQHLLERLPQGISELWLATATGGTLLGLALALHELPLHHPLKTMRLKAVLVLKNPAFEVELGELLTEFNRSSKQLVSLQSVMASIDIIAFDELGRYASVSEPMRGFHRVLEQQLTEPVDQVYMLKVFYALSLRLKSSKLLGRAALLHTGGQQGRRGF